MWRKQEVSEEGSKEMEKGGWGRKVQRRKAKKRYKNIYIEYNEKNII